MISCALLRRLSALPAAVLLAGPAAADAAELGDYGPLAERLASADRQLSFKLGRGLALLAGGEFLPGHPLLRRRAGLVLVDAVASGSPAGLLSRLEALGLQSASRHGRIVSGWLPEAVLEESALLPELRFLRPSMAMTWRGAATSQGDIALAADTARSEFSIDGSGVTVGVLSDSFDCLGGAFGDVASDDLPAGIGVLEEEALCASGSDEGRAMMQIVHDLAPGSSQLFHTAFNGQADFASGILELAGAGADIVTDDVIYFAEPMFQDGPIAQAIDTVVEQGISYFSAAGNGGDDAYESAFRPSGLPGVFPNSETHDFDPGPGVDDRQLVTLPADGLGIVVLQWDQPFFSISGAPGSQSDVDILLISADGTELLAASIENNVGADPVEVLAFQNDGPAETFQLQIELAQGAAPAVFRYVLFGDIRVEEFAPGAPTLYGHANAAGAIAVAAARYDRTPAFGLSPPRVESFSALGGVPILFDLDGNPVAIDRGKPDITAANGGDTTFFGFDYEGNGLPNFFGTSAAAPHAAGVAALLLDYAPGLPPAMLGSVLASSAIDMAEPGADTRTGAGLIQANAALALLLPPPDADEDGIEDALDNCLFVPNGPLAPDAGGNSQLDTDADGFGNICDADLNNDGIVNFTDLGGFKAVFGSPDANADLNGDGLVNFADLALLKMYFAQPPGPGATAP